MNNKIEALIKIISDMPGLGPKSARRIVLHLLKSREQNMPKIINTLQEVYQSMSECHICGNLDCNSPCAICSNKKRDDSTICVIEDLTDLWAIEKSKVYSGKYHILGGVLSAIDGITPNVLSIKSLVKRTQTSEIKELIIATNATIEGQTTGQYIANLFKEKNIKVSFLAYGMPIGSEMDYLDEGTLNIAFCNRK